MRYSFEDLKHWKTLLYINLEHIKFKVKLSWSQIKIKLSIWQKAIRKSQKKKKRIRVNNCLYFIYVCNNMQRYMGFELWKIKLICLDMSVSHTVLPIAIWNMSNVSPFEHWLFYKWKKKKMINYNWRSINLNNLIRWSINLNNLEWDRKICIWVWVWLFITG